MRLLPLFLLVACGPALHTDAGQIGIALPNMIDPATDGVPNAFLVGTTADYVLTCAGDCPEGTPEVAPCFTQTVEGAATLGASTLSFDAAGEVVWRFTAMPCPANDLGWVPTDDAITLTAVDPAGVTGHFAHVYEEWAGSYIAAGLLRLEAPEGWLPAAGAPAYVFADRDVGVFPRLWTSAGDAVAFPHDDAVLSSTPPAVTFEVDSATVRIGAGDSSAVSLTVAGTTLSMGEVIGVDPGEAVAMDLAVAYSVGEGGTDTPSAARAVVWDGEGNPVFGAPVTWTFDRDMDLSIFGDAFADYAMLGDACVPPSADYGPQTAMLTARYGELSASIPLAWTPRFEPGDDAEWETSPTCGTTFGGEDEEDTGTPAQEKGRCGCGTGAAPGLLPAVLAMAAARRRRITPPRSPSGRPGSPPSNPPCFGNS